MFSSRKKEKQSAPRNTIQIDDDEVVEVSRSVRALPPVHFLWKLESYVDIKKDKTGKVESNSFEANGYNWKLLLYPNDGKKNENGRSPISVYLALIDSNDFPNGWEVFVEYKLFVYDHMKDTYHTFRDTKVRRFHEGNGRCGFDNILSLTSPKDSSVQYLKNGRCVLGAEVFVIKPISSYAVVNRKEPLAKSFTWKIPNVSKIKKDSICSEVFNLVGWKWKLQLFPKGDKVGHPNYLSLFLKLVDPAFHSSDDNLFLRFQLRINKTFSVHSAKEGTVQFRGDVKNWGFQKFFALEELKKESNYLVYDCITVGVDVLGFGLEQMI